MKEEILNDLYYSTTKHKRTYKRTLFCFARDPRKEHHNNTLSLNHYQFIMFRLTSLSLFLFATAHASANAVLDQGSSSSSGTLGILAKFRQWVEEHGKVYESAQEEVRRMKVWASNHGTLSDDYFINTRQIVIP